MLPLCLTGTLSRTFSISLPIFTAVQYSPKWIWFVLTTRFLWPRRIFPKQPSPRLLVCSSILACPTASGTLHRLSSVLWTLSSAVFPFFWAYLDDLLIASSSHDLHKSHLRAVFTRLQEFGIRVNPDKCVLGVPSLTFLGHTISASGVQPLPDRVAAIRQFPLLETQRQLRQFLGMITFYHRFIPSAAALLTPLTSLLKGKKRGQSTKVTWSDAARQTFSDAKSALAEATLLVFPQESAPTRLQVDASEFAVGGVLQQYQNEMWVPLAFFSKKTPTGGDTVQCLQSGTFGHVFGYQTLPLFSRGTFFSHSD